MWDGTIRTGGNTGTMSADRRHRSIAALKQRKKHQAEDS
jgi:hypothetical protein